MGWIGVAFGLSLLDWFAFGWCLNVGLLDVWVERGWSDFADFIGNVYC